MHPIERLRFVARSTEAPHGALASEAAQALSAFTDDPAVLLTACRRVVARQPGAAPLVWLSARVLLATDPGREVWEAAGELAADATSTQLARALPDGATTVVLGWPELGAEALARRGDLHVLVVDAGEAGDALVGQLLRRDADATSVPADGLGAAVAAADLVVLEATAVGPESFLAVAGSRAAAAVARHAGAPVWLVAGVGRLLPQRMWDGVAAAAVPVVAEPWDVAVEVVPLDLVDRVVGPTGLTTVAEALARTDCPVAPELFAGIAL
jgi:hypothetical protein